MRIKNKKAKTNYVNYKSSGMPKRIGIQAGKTANIPAITNVLQITNFGDFQRGFFEIIAEDLVVVKKTTSKKKAKKAKKVKKAKKSTDSLAKVEKEVKDYTDNKE